MTARRDENTPRVTPGTNKCVYIFGPQKPAVMVTDFRTDKPSCFGRKQISHTKPLPSSAGFSKSLVIYTLHAWSCKYSSTTLSSSPQAKHEVRHVRLPHTIRHVSQATPCTDVTDSLCKSQTCPVAILNCDNEASPSTLFSRRS